MSQTPETALKEICSSSQRPETKSQTGETTSQRGETTSQARRRTIVSPRLLLRFGACDVDSGRLRRRLRITRRIASKRHQDEQNRIGDRLARLRRRLSCPRTRVSALIEPASPSVVVVTALRGRSLRSSHRYPARCPRRPPTAPTRVPIRSPISARLVLVERGRPDPKRDHPGWPRGARPRAGLSRRQVLIMKTAAKLSSSSSTSTATSSSATTAASAADTATPPPLLTNIPTVTAAAVEALVSAIDSFASSSARSSSCRSPRI